MGPEAQCAGRGQSGVGGQEGRGAGLRCSGTLSWLLGEMGALLPEKVSMAFIAQCSSGQSTKA